MGAAEGSKILPDAARGPAAYPALGGAAGVNPSIPLDFLGSRPFRYKGPDSEGWISLDFLGFSRPNLYLSMGYAGFRGKQISRAFSLG
jgi:hypothetical protein